MQVFKILLPFIMVTKGIVSMPTYDLFDEYLNMIEMLLYNPMPIIYGTICETCAKYQVHISWAIIGLFKIESGTAEEIMYEIVSVYELSLVREKYCSLNKDMSIKSFFTYNGNEWNGACWMLFRCEYYHTPPRIIYPLHSYCYTRIELLYPDANDAVTCWFEGWTKWLTY